MQNSTPSPTKHPNPWFVGVVSGMASYIDSCAIVSSGTALTIYQLTSGYSDGQVGLASMGLTLAIAGGALFGGKLGDSFGRKHVFSATMVLIAVGAALQVFAGSFTMLMVGTILVGLGTGADLPVSLANIAETATDENRGKIIGLSNILWTVGILGAIACASIVGNWGHLGGQILYAQVGIVAVIVLLLRLPLPESHVWLEAQAEKKAGVETVRAERSQLRLLLQSPYAKPFFALIFFYALVNIPANTGGQFGTWVAVNVIHMDVAFTSRLGLIMMPLGFIWGVWFMKIVDTDKRMPYFYVGALLFAGAYLIYPIFGFSVVTYIAVSVINGIGSGFAFEGIMKVWTQESFPTLLRTTAQGTIIAVARVVAALAASVTPLLLRAGPEIAYAALAAIAAVGYAFAIWGFRHKTRNEFDVESHSIEDVKAAEEAGVDFTISAEPKA
ncbi:MFS transporter [Actinomyces faecalis]|uniref:MFS transporter n=1 Tax=Actinomyces faecalis TaxID=2722820 RepID=UPI001FD5DC19|nr:MFS transporter [Actinomyces faecalis]